MLKSVRTSLRIVILAAVFVVTYAIPTYGSAATRTASAARTITLREIGHLRRVGKGSSSNFHEVGSQSGTLGGTMEVWIATSYTTASVKFIVNPGGGSFHGEGVVSYYVAGNVAHFNGGVKITGGNGKYAHIHASRMQINGSMQRSNFAATMTISGTIRI
jgi:hypothetical protein